MKYLLPCQRCREKLVVDMSQAGRQVTCRCGATLEVPSLRGIRALETVAETAAGPPARTWNPTRGALFAVGLVVALVGLAFAGLSGFSLLNARIPPSPPLNLEASLAEANSLTPGAAWDVWLDLREKGLGPYVPPAKYLMEQSIQRVSRVMFIGFGAVVAGLVMAVTSILLPGRPGATKTPDAGRRRG